jgi:hypothetical protein
MTDRPTPGRVAPVTLVLSTLAIGAFIVAEFLRPGAGPWAMRAVGFGVVLWVLWILRRARTA